MLRYYHGFSEAEMAVALGCRRGTVKSRLHSALRRLELLLRESGVQENALDRGRDANVFKRRGTVVRRGKRKCKIRGNSHIEERLIADALS